MCYLKHGMCSFFFPMVEGERNAGRVLSYYRIIVLAYSSPIVPLMVLSPSRVSNCLTWWGDLVIEGKDANLAIKDRTRK